MNRFGNDIRGCRARGTLLERKRSTGVFLILLATDLDCSLPFSVRAAPVLVVALNANEIVLGFSVANDIYGFHRMRGWLDTFRTIDWKPIKQDFELSGILSLYALTAPTESY